MSGHRTDFGLSTASWSDSGRYRFIDALRGVAVLLVLIIHISEIYVQISSNGRHSGRWIADISHEFDFGRMGVTIFFLISGFVIPGSFVGDRINGTLKFLISRFFRLFPLFWLCVFLSLVTQEWTAGRFPNWSAIFLNLTMLPQFFGVSPVNGAYWTLAVELVFYGLCVLLAITVGIKNLNIIGILSIALIATFFDREYGYRIQFLQGPFGDYPMLLGMMFWGALARARFEDSRLPLIAEVAYWLAALWWLIGFPMAGFHEAFARTHAEVDLVPRMYGSYFCAFAIFFYSVHFFRFKATALEFVGKISYSVYLIHGPVMYSIIFILDNYLGYFKFRFSLYAWLAIVTALTIVISSLTYRFVERPFQRMGKKLASAFKP